MSRKCGLVVLRDGGGTAGAERLEDLFSQDEIVRRWLAAMLEKWVGGMRLCQCNLVVVGEVDVVEGEGDHGEGVWRGPEGVLEG